MTALGPMDSAFWDKTPKPPPPPVPDRPDVMSALHAFTKDPMHQAMADASAAERAARVEYEKLCAKRAAMIRELAESVRLAGYPWGDTEPRTDVRWSSMMPGQAPATGFRVDGVWHRAG